MTKPTAEEPLIAVRGLEKSFAGKHVLRGVDLEVMPGETMVVLGGSGEGKTVLLRHMNGLLRPDRGSVWFNGQNLDRLDENALGEIRKQVAMVFQLGALFDSLTVFQNVSYPLHEHTKLSAAAIRDRVRELMQAVGLGDGRVERLYPAELSGGMRKRVALARALALRPRAVLYDEPTTGLDPLVTDRIVRMIRSLQKRFGYTSVVVTHDLKSGFAVGDRFALLDQGKIRLAGTAEEVRASSDELMQEFLRTAL